MPTDFGALYLCDTLLYYCEYNGVLYISESKTTKNVNISVKLLQFSDHIVDVNEPRFLFFCFFFFWKIKGLPKLNIQESNWSRSQLYLVRIKFNIYQGHPLIHLIVVFYHPMYCLRDILKYKVQIQLFFFSSWKETVLQGHNVGVV